MCRFIGTGRAAGAIPLGEPREQVRVRTLEPVDLFAAVATQQSDRHAGSDRANELPGSACALPAQEYAHGVARLVHIAIVATAAREGAGDGATGVRCENEGVTIAPPGGEPDYRVSLAAERTYLAYVRTSIALLAAGVAVVAVLPDAGHVGLRRVVGLVLVVLGLLLVGTARKHLRDIDRAVRAGKPLPRNPADPMLVVGLAVAGALAVVLVLVV